MGEDPEFYRNAITSQFMEIAKSLEGLAPPEVVAGLRNSFLEILEQQFRDGMWSKVERHKLIAFIEDLLERQGTIPPNLESLYECKAELDRKFFGGNSK